MNQRMMMFSQTALALGALATVAGAQPCEPRWSDEFGIGADARVNALEATSRELYAGGDFTSIGGAPAARVARHEDGAWAPLGAGFTQPTSCHGQPPFVWSLLNVELPSPSGLVAGGALPDVGGALGLWDGAEWRSLGDFRVTCCPDTCPAAFALATFDDGRGPALYVAGSFDQPENGIARWDGQWKGLGTGLIGLFGPGLLTGRSLLVHDDGSGPALYVGGSFHSAGGAAVQNIARWRSSEWTDVGGGLGMLVGALTELEIDGRPQLIAGGGFGATGEIWRWDGAVWTRMGGVFNDPIRALAVFDDGSGLGLYAGGAFTVYNGAPIRNLARWDKRGWVEVVGGAGGAVTALETQPHKGVWSLLVGGSFLSVGAGVPSQRIARLIGCAPVCYADCDRSGELTFFDFLCFQNLFAAMDPGADCDGDGEFTFFDFLCFQNAFAAGCE
jgi:hypothetical protein